ncbi:MAG: tRNA (adenosine(37)-N6)-threonylcarbamoyltransferase complex transferase subunit TsaD [Saprospiraceae bacterium]|nr:tRNA (adenosine(37)-N6)-threonylcarbamoyltransferase complex transferase subunit TsaD [Saprospiraceae bacterium]
MSIILAIESSCDDTSAAVIIDGIVKSNVTATQKIHEKYGGVVPEVASRKHQSNIIPVVDEALKNANIDVNNLSAIAVTKGPGLLGSLIVGVSFAKGLALSLGIPIIEVNHMMAHVLAHYADDPKPNFPFLCLTVSGGHTQIVRVNSPFEMIVIGSTIDDAAGEAFDKTGKIMGLKYPAGPIIDKLAQTGNPVYSFTEPNIEGLNFSFSGLKTSILYFLKAQLKENPNFIDENLADICASVQDRIVSILLNKIKNAAEQTGIHEIAIAGGVSANSGLRKAIKQAGAELNWNTYIPEFQYCTDNAGMIGIAAYFKYMKNDFADLTLVPSARMIMH